ncbi:MAG: acyl-CoA dehydrogenase family protein [Mycobacteriaceae bacterium]|nr:acyl-CoA dehydrogenase family protein [Mycobacteriaceae bacterium]
MIEVQEFRAEVREWLADNLVGEFAALKGLGGPGREDEAFEERLAWNRMLAGAGLTCLGWPVEHGGRGLSVTHRVAFYEEYALADAPAKVNHFGEELLGPTLIEFGTPEQQKRFLPKILDVTELWCQGYSEPGAGSDLANVSTTAVLDGDQWVINGQKVWTSLAQWSDWCFVVARTERGSQRHNGLSYLLIRMDAPGIEVRPIRQITGTAEFNEVFFTDARTPADLIVGHPGDGWKVAMGTLAFERGALTLGQQMAFERELDDIRRVAHANGSIDDPMIRQKLTDLWIRLRIMRANSLRTLSVDEHVQLVREAMIGKLFWANLHQDMGEVAMDVMGAAAMVVDDRYDAHEPLGALHRLFMFTRADTIYGGSDQIQRNVIGERALGLPREPR